MSLAIYLEREEKTFIQSLVMKEKWAQRIVYEELYPEMLIVCIRYSSSKEDALDILHDAFIKVFKNVGKYEVGTSFKSWVKRIMVNTSIDHYRREKRRWTDDIVMAYNVKADNVTAIDQISEKEILIGIQGLPPVYRLVFNLYVIEGYTHREIAEMLKINESTSRSNLVKARNKLKNFLNTTQDPYDK